MLGRHFRFGNGPTNEPTANLSLIVSTFEVRKWTSVRNEKSRELDWYEYHCGTPLNFTFITISLKIHENILGIIIRL